MESIQKKDLYYEDIQEGVVFQTPSRTVSESDIMLFAGLTGDFNELHTSSMFAAKTPFGERIAHGMLTLAIANGLYMQMGYFNHSTVANLGIEEWRFKKAVRINDTLYVRITLKDKRYTSNPSRGVIHWNVEVCNQENEVVACGIWTKMIMCFSHSGTTVPVGS